MKRLDEFGGDVSQVHGGRLHPSRMRQICVAKTEPGDENKQDISSLVGKVDIRKLEIFSQADADAYAYSGGLNRANQGILEFVEMFKAPIKMLHPLLTATQESNYIGSENIGAIPDQGIILAHSNEAEWQGFKRQQQQRGLHRPHLRDQGAVLPARDRRAADLREAARRAASLPARRARPARSRCWPASACCRASSTRIRTCSRRCAPMTAKA